MCGVEQNHFFNPARINLGQQRAVFGEIVSQQIGRVTW
jgi:hypothetical protein